MQEQLLQEKGGRNFILQLNLAEMQTLQPHSPPLQPMNTENQSLLISKKTETVSLKSLYLRWRELVPFLGVFAPLVVFWAIFYQQNSTWVQQGNEMDCYLGSLHIPPGKHTHFTVIHNVMHILKTLYSTCLCQGAQDLLEYSIILCTLTVNTGCSVFTPLYTTEYI